MKQKWMMGILISCVMALLTVVLFSGLIMALSIEQVMAADFVPYQYYASDSAAVAGSISNGSVDDYTIVESSDSKVTWNSGWYVVNKNVTITGRITVSGEVHLILCDNCTLTAEAGITVADDDQNGGTSSKNILNIYGQSGGTGTLISGIDGKCKEDNAGLGGEYEKSIYGSVKKSDCGTITIHGGIVKASGTSWAADIGGAIGGSSGSITINGGIVDVSDTPSKTGIGFGNSYYEERGGSITINGGVVNSHRTDCSGCLRSENVNIAGGTVCLGGGESTAILCYGTVRISGGTLYANYDKDTGKAIAGSDSGIYTYAKAEGAVSRVIITGGTVYAYSDNYGPAYGIKAETEAIITGGTVIASGKKMAINSPKVVNSIIGLAWFDTEGTVGEKVISPGSTEIDYSQYRKAHFENSAHAHNGIFFDEWTDASAAEQYSDSSYKADNCLPKKEGNYCLTKDVNLGSDDWDVPVGTTRLCLNGRTITSNDDDATIELDSNCTLNIYDEHTGDSAGLITNTREDGIRLEHGPSELNMYGGAISADDNGVLLDDNSAHFNMYGGTISRTDTGVDIDDKSAVFYMSGGVITNNRYRGVEADGIFKISGNPQITGNGKDGKAENVCLSSGNKITVTGALTREASIGVMFLYPSDGEVFTDGLSGKLPAGKTVAGIFSSDNSDYFVSETTDGEAQLVKKEPVATPTFSPAGGKYTEAQSVTLSCATEGAKIYFTTDGTAPTTGSYVYSAPISVSSTVTIKAIAVKGGMLNSAVATAEYEIDYSPIGCVDSINGNVGSIDVSGWAFDPSDTSKSIDVHVYIGGDKDASGAEEHAITANKKRTDVDEIHHCGDNHGFSNTITTSKRGSLPIYIYAINIGEGKDVCLRHETVTISDPTPTHSVTITPGDNMTKTTDSGAELQTGLSGAMTGVVYIANDDYYFPTDYNVAASNGITVTRNSYTQITVSGTPTANVALELTAATEKGNQTAPTGLTATKASSNTAADGKISGVTDAMEYQKDGDTSWTSVGENKTEITGLTTGTYKVRYAETADQNASSAATVEVGVKEDQTAPTGLTSETPVRIVWKDGNDEDKLRPNSLVLNVYLKNGSTTTLTLTVDRDWSDSVNGDVERIVPDWGLVNLSVGDAHGQDTNGQYRYVAAKENDGFTLTLIHTPQTTTSAGVMIVWEDGEDADGLRPESLKVTLSNGCEFTVSEKSAQGGWMYVMGNLPKYEKGMEIEYTWTVNDMPKGYQLTETEVEDYTTFLTLTHDLEKTELTVKMIWDDEENKDKKRPDSLTVTLLANGKATDRKATLNKNSWTATLEKLPKNENGSEIKYTWSESEPEWFAVTGTATEGNTTTLTNTIRYQVDFNPGEGGAGSMESQAIIKGRTFTFPKCTLDPPAEMTFDHWKMSGADGIYYPDDPIEIAGNCATGGVITVTAFWKEAPPAVITTAPGAKNPTYNGNAQELVTKGAAENGTMYYAVGNSSTILPTEGWSTKVPAGTSAGTWYVWYKAVGDKDYSDSKAECCQVEIKKRSVTATVTAIDRDYEAGNKSVSLTAGTVNDAVAGDDVTVDVSAASGTMADDSAGPDKTVTVTGVKLAGTTAGNYTLSAQPTGVTVTINKANAVPATVTANNRTCDGTEKPLLTVDSSTLGVGCTMYYALGENATTPPEADAENIPEEQKKWKTSVPNATATGTYYVWYKVVGDSNHKDTQPTPITVTISRPYSGGSSSAINIPLINGDSGETFNITGTISGSTVNLNTISEDIFNKAARTNGSVIIDVSGLKKDIKEIRFNAATVKCLKNSDVKSLEIILTDGSIILDKKTIDTMEAASSGTDPLKVHIEKVKISSLTKAQQEALKGVDSPIIFDVTLTRGNVEIHDLDGGKVTIKAKYESSEGKAPDLFYLTEAGVLKRVANAEYKDGFLTWTGDHCSVYVIKEISIDSGNVNKKIDALGEDPDPEKVAEARIAYEALDDKKSEIDGSVVKTLEAAERKVALDKATEVMKAAEKYKDDAAVKAAREELEKEVESGKTGDIVKATNALETAVKAAEAAEETKKAAEEKEAAEKKAAQEKAAKELADAVSAARTALKTAEAYSNYASVKAAIDALKETLAGNDAAAIKAATTALNNAVNTAKDKTAPATLKPASVKLKKAKYTIKRGKTARIKVKKSTNGKMTFKKIKGNKNITVNKTGKIKVKKGAKKGRTYKIKVKITTAATTSYKAGKLIRTIRVRVR